jgi:DNA helicase-2/ATP-dependent DNA helicase PcrA
MHSGYSGRTGSGEFTRTNAAVKKQLPQTTLASGKKQAPMLELNKGDMVKHNTFGRGMVLSVTKMGADALLEIAFDEIGTRKMLAKTASAHMKKL